MSAAAAMSSGVGHQVQPGAFALGGGMQGRDDVVGQRDLLAVVAVGFPRQHRVVQRGQFGVGSIGEVAGRPVAGKHRHRLRSDTGPRIPSAAAATRALNAAAPTATALAR